MTEKSVDAGTLFRAHSKFVSHFLLRFGTPPEEVQDLVQEVFMVAHRKGGFIDRGAKPTSWLAAIAIRIACERRRKRSRKQLHERIDVDAIVSATAPASSPRERTENREQLKRVRRALRRLSGPKRAVFVMAEIDGRTCEEIAETLRIPVGTVYSRLHSARSLFGRYYQSPVAQRPIALSDSLSFVSLGV